MTLLSILKKFGIVIIALIALLLTRVGISYLIILIGIGIVTPIICGNKRSAVISGILYATLSYIISYPSGLFLKNYMPTISIPITVSPFEVMLNLFTGWLIPVLITIIITGMSSFIGMWIAEKINKENLEESDEGYYFEKSEKEEDKKDYQDKGNIVQKDNKKFTKKQKKDLLSLTPIQKAKNRYNKDNDRKW